MFLDKKSRGFLYAHTKYITRPCAFLDLFFDFAIRIHLHSRTSKFFSKTNLSGARVFSSNHVVAYRRNNCDFDFAARSNAFAHTDLNNDTALRRHEFHLCVYGLPLFSMNMVLFIIFYYSVWFVFLPLSLEATRA